MIFVAASGVSNEAGHPADRTQAGQRKTANRHRVPVAGAIVAANRLGFSFVEVLTGAKQSFDGLENRFSSTSDQAVSRATHRDAFAQPNSGGQDQANSSRLFNNGLNEPCGRHIEPAMRRIGGDDAAAEPPKGENFRNAFQCITEKPRAWTETHASFGRPNADQPQAVKLIEIVDESFGNAGKGGNGENWIETGKSPAKPLVVWQPREQRQSPSQQTLLWPCDMEIGHGSSLFGPAQLPSLRRNGLQANRQSAPLLRIEPEDGISRFAPQSRSKNRATSVAPLLISFLLGAAATAIMPAAFGKIAAWQAIRFRHGPNITDIGRTDDPLALPRMYRDNRLLSYVGIAANRSTKRPYVDLAAGAGMSATDATITADRGSTTPKEVPEDQISSVNPTGIAQVNASELSARSGVKSLPSLYFDASTQRQVIGNFETRSFPGDPQSCTKIAQSMLDDIGAERDSLYTLADTQEIKVMRICASNGAVIISCRNDRITISPRRPRPGDGCSKHYVL